jgi:hypothetical protein
MIRVFVGFDARETEAFHVLSHSIHRHASQPVSITPLIRSQLRRIHTRERGPRESTDFSLTRFLVPYLCGYQGQAIFMDCDMLLRADIAEVLAYYDPSKAVSVCQHDYQTKATSKFLGQKNEPYPRKNWSSFMVFNAARCTALTPEFVNTATPATLHRFAWVPDAEIGSLPLTWNWLVTEYPKREDVQNAHFTLGTPCFEEYRACDYADEWFAERALMHAVTQPEVA